MRRPIASGDVLLDLITEIDMKHLTTSITLVLLALASLPAVAGGDPVRNGALATASNRITGLWNNVGQVGPCGGTPVQPIHQTLMFLAGGGFVDNSPYPPQGAPGPGGLNQRSIGLGTWSYDPLTAQYTLDQRFDWFVNNVYSGYQVVHRTMLLGNAGTTASGPVRTIRYAANGSVVFDLCGSAVSTRL
jgi:hypothetical protein